MLGLMVSILDSLKRSRRKQDLTFEFQISDHQVPYFMVYLSLYFALLLTLYGFVFVFCTVFSVDIILDSLSHNVRLLLTLQTPFLVEICFGCL